MTDNNKQFEVPEAPKPFVPEVKSEQVVEEQPVKEQPEVKQDSSIEAKICPHCGLEYNKALVVAEPSRDDKTVWLRHILGEPRFTKEFVELGGKLKVVLRSRTTEENDQIFAQLEDDIKNGVISDAPIAVNAAYIHRMQRLMLACSLKSISPIHENDYPVITSKDYSDPTKRAVVVAHDKLIAPMSEGMLAILLACIKKFESITRVLIMHTEDENFWQPTDGHR